MRVRRPVFRGYPAGKCRVNKYKRTSHVTSSEVIKKKVLRIFFKIHREIAAMNVKLLHLLEEALWNKETSQLCWKLGEKRVNIGLRPFICFGAYILLYYSIFHFQLLFNCDVQSCFFKIWYHLSYQVRKFFY